MTKEEINQLKQLFAFAQPGQVDIRGLLINLADEIREIQEWIIVEKNKKEILLQDDPVKVISTPINEP